MTAADSLPPRMPGWTANIGLWGTPRQGYVTWIVDQSGKPVCTADQTSERSIARLTALGYTVLPRNGETIQSLLSRGYLQP